MRQILKWLRFGGRGGLPGRCFVAFAAAGLLAVTVEPLGAAAPAPVVVVDPFCSLTNFGPALGPSPTQPESNRRMAERLAAINRAMDPFTNPYLSNQRADALLEELPKTTNLATQINLGLSLSVTLLQAGRTTECLNAFRALEECFSANGLTMNPKLQSEVHMREAIAMLRLGEQENCIANHNAQSCLFPLESAAYHQFPRGSLGAIAVLERGLSQNPADLSARWLLNIAYMTLGEFPDRVPSQWLIPQQTFASDIEFPRFPDIAGGLGLDTEGLAGSCIVDDFDNDGYLDIVTSSWSLTGQLRYFHNDGNGRFTERTREAGLTGLVGGLNIMQTDYNNDGLLDIWIPRGAWLGKLGRIPGSLLRNNGDGTFTDVTEASGLFRSHPSQASVWFDYDGDGWLDLFIGNESTDPKDPDPSELFHNNHDGTFTECAVASGLDVKAFVKGVASADYDNDGRPDLYLSIQGAPNRLFHNDGPDAQGRWQFSDVTARAGVSEPLFSFPTWFFDYDNDGWEDLFVSGYAVQNVGDIAADYLGQPSKGAKPKLYHNNRDGTFTDVTAAAHLDHVYLTMGCNFGDLDNDGWLDFYLGTGNPDLAMLIPNRMLHNAGGKYFQDVTTAGGFGHLQKGHGVAFADLDNDGQQDVFAVIGGAFPGDVAHKVLFHNPGNTNHWVKLKLEGTKSNRAAIGARIKVNVATPDGNRAIYKTVNSGGSFGSSPLRQEIGLDAATAITSVEIFWPASGLRQTLTGLALDQAYHVREGEAAATPLDLKRIKFDLAAMPAYHPTAPVTP